MNCRALVSVCSQRCQGVRTWRRRDLRWDVAEKFGVEHVAIGTDIAYESRFAAAERAKIPQRDAAAPRPPRWEALWPEGSLPVASIHPVRSSKVMPRITGLGGYGGFCSGSAEVTAYYRTAHDAAGTHD